MEIIYRANDGKEFSDKDACIEYESSLETFSTNTVFIDSEKNYIALKDFREKYLDVFGMRIPDMKTAKAIHDILTDEGYLMGDANFPNPGYYWYDNEKSDWVNIDKEIEELNNIKDALDSYS